MSTFGFLAVDWLAMLHGEPAEVSRGLGLFVRSLVGRDREAAKEALAGFLARKTLSANQID